MLKNYLKIAWRTLWKNRIFSIINVLGLAISMSVGLLMIAFVSDLLSYDNFHKKKDRIYRVITSSKQAGGFETNLASSSLRAGKLIKASVPQVEELTMIRSGFDGDAEVDENKIPIQGLWANNAFLSVFSFPLQHGDPKTALKEPFSIVLTEKSAEKLFGETNVLGRLIRFDSLDYTVTGVMHNIPRLSHLQFESLISFSTAELQKPDTDGDFDSWQNFFINYTYLTLPENQDIQLIQESLDRLCLEENASIESQTISLALQPLNHISIGNFLANEIGPVMDVVAIWVLGIMTLIVIFSACFNYTNLSIARSLKRAREVGIRKVIGGLKSHVMSQFIIEAILISLIALTFSFPLFLLLRDQVISLHPFINEIVTLQLSAKTMLGFVLLALIIGFVAGIFPAFFFSKIKSIQVLKGFSSLRLFRHINLRKSLIVIQYVFSLTFITITIIGYNQYKGFLVFDLGYSTENIVNINLQGNNGELLRQKLSELPEVSEISQSRNIAGLGSVNGAQLKYERLNDSSQVFQNYVDEYYLPLHRHKFIAGGNFSHGSANSMENEVIVNEQVIKRFNISDGDPHRAIGEKLTIDGENAIIVGVLKDFHYIILTAPIKPFVLRYSANPGVYINVKLTSNDWPSTLTSIEKAWKELDNVHPLEAKFYDDQIEQAYTQFSMMIKVIGMLSFLTIFISSIGLFGMVVFTTETKLKEISIRKVFGARNESLVFLLSKQFMLLLIVSASIALPASYLFLDKVILINFAYHQPIGLMELLTGFLGVLVIALTMIGSHTLNAARVNPIKMLQDE
ncbi:MAG: ABC transporter permease [Cyclobacteriaceae bacterium]